MSTAEQTSELLDPKFLRRLEQLQLFSQRVFRGQMRGERRSRRKGISIEFADYRDYARGDDLRFIDWNIYGRLERLFVKLFLEEQDLYFYLLIDVSQSMDWGEKNKLAYAKKVAAALGYIGLSHLDKVGIFGFSAEETKTFTPKAGRFYTLRMLQFLDSLEPKGQTSLNDFCHNFVMKNRRRGIVILLSDLLDPGGYEDALKSLTYGGNEVYIMHVLADEELEPKITGHLDLIDMETQDHTEITAGAQMLDVYKRTVNAFCSQIKSFCGRYNMDYMLTLSSSDFEHMILTVLRARGLVK